MKYMQWIFLVAMVIITSCGNNSSTAEAPIDLVVSENFKNPIGFYNPKPSFSWKLPVTEQIKSQSAYRIVVATNPALLPDNADLWDTNTVDSDQSVWVNYEGAPLESRQKVWWQIMFWDQDGNSSRWSEVAYVELGLLHNSDWQAKWINLPEAEVPDIMDNGYYFHRPQYFRKSFNLENPISQARLYITSKGVFEAEINGIRVGEDVMTPGWTPYKKRIETLTYDVTDRLKKGENAIGVVVAEGWYSGRIAYARSFVGEKPVPQLICQLEITFQDGARQIVASDASWSGTTNGPIRFSDIYEGEDYDANMEMSGWSTPDFKAEDWIAAEEMELDSEIKLLPKRHSAVREKMKLPVISITEPESGKFIFDLGQNMVGVAEVNIPVKKNQKITIRFAEMLQQDGTLYTANYRSARSTDYYIPKDDGMIKWKPKFTFHGFRYVELSGFDSTASPEKDWVAGIVQYSDFEQTGSFTSSHEKLNKLQSNIVWGLRGNFFDIPTDCPQRDERMGWTGDAQVFAPTSIFNSSVHSFWASWLQSAREEQFVDGGIPNVIPNNRGNSSSAGWADAITIIPWEMYLRTGDKSILEENFSMMQKLVGYYHMKPESRFGELNSFGDWLQPYSHNKEDDRKGDTPNELIESAYFAHSIQLTLNAAKVLGYDKEIAELQAVKDSVVMAFRNKFLDENGKLTTALETQTGYLLILTFDLVSPEMAKKIVPRLLNTIEEADNHLRTGFLGTPLLAPVLHKYGETDLLYSILFKETYPSWFYSINQGATTMWERWNSFSHDEGFGEVSMNSFNHYAYGAIGQWMYEGIAGISALEPGYKKILIAPTLGIPLEFARADYTSGYGVISSAWKKLTNGLELKVTIPPNTTARVIIPVEIGMKVLLDEGEIASNSNVSLVERNDASMVLELMPGKYAFKTQQ
ncbi:MAG: family 78 glycoside hydrolase catalytic domain [Cyclobacteriaceae bacterium]|nr:family 78 glycoside hydrolase catalytic domain [Cyclobacteriaceae bacterium]